MRVTWGWPRGSLFDARSMTFLAASRRATALLDGTGDIVRRSRHPCTHTDYEVVKDTCSSRRDRVASGAGLSVVINLLLFKIEQSCKVTVTERRLHRQERVSLVWRARTVREAAQAVASCNLLDCDAADATHVVTAVTYVTRSARRDDHGAGPALRPGVGGLDGSSRSLSSCVLLLLLSLLVVVVQVWALHVVQLPGVHG